jgi:hypothetical protein
MNSNRLILYCSIAFLLSSAALARAGTRLEKNLKLDAGGTLFVDAGGGDLIVRGTETVGARVVVTANVDNLDEYFDLRFEEEPHAVRLTAHRHSAWSWPHHLNLKFTIEVPRRTSLELRTGGGDVRIADLEGTFDLHTSGGDVEADEVRGNLQGTTSGGDIKGRQLAGDVELHTSGGDIKAEDVGGRVDVHTSGGDVVVSLARGNARGGEVETTGGDVTVTLDPAANLELLVSTDSGDIHSGLSVQGTVAPSTLHGTLGKGGALLRVRTSGGDIHLNSL